MYVSLDLETTGFDREKDHIIEFGAVKFNLNGETERLQFFVKSPIPIPPIVTHITNIHDEDLIDALPFDERIEEIQNFIGDLPIIGHNIEFDTGFLRSKGVTVPGPDFDTHILAGMLLPNLTSYSLEVISQTLGLNHEDKHRALDDAIAAMELFLELIKRFENIDHDLLTKIQHLSAKSTWPLDQLVQNLNHTKTTFAPLNPPRLIKKSKFEATKTLESQATLIDLAPPYEELIKTLSEKSPADTFISIPYENFRRITNFIPDEIAKIDCKNQYISLHRLAKIQEKDHYNNEEISALIKTLIWLQDTKTGLLSEMRIIGKEKHLIDRICIDENQNNLDKETFYQKAHSKAPQHPQISTHQYLLSDECTNKNHNLILIDLEQFKHRLHRNLSIFLKEEFLLDDTLENLQPQSHPAIQSLKDKTQMLFALLEKIFDENNDKNEYSPRCNITPTIRAFPAWQNAVETFKGIFEISKQLKDLDNEENFFLLQKWKKALADFNQVFLGTPCKSNLMWLEPNYKDQKISLRRIPGNIDEELQKFLNQFQSFQIIGEGVALEEKLTSKYNLEIIEEKDPNLIINFTENTLSEQEIDNRLLEILQTKPGRTAIIVNSKKRLHELTLFLSKQKIPLVSQLTSSTGKLKAKYKELQDSAVLLLTPNVWLNLEDYDAFDTLYIYKIPFDAPGKPELIAESEGKRNAFIEVFLKRAVATLTAIINRLEKSNDAADHPSTNMDFIRTDEMQGNNERLPEPYQSVRRQRREADDAADRGSKKSVTIIDDRVTKKDYGRAISQKLAKLGQTEISTNF